MASRYYDVLESSTAAEDMKKPIFLQFNEEVYKMILDDTIHLNEVHKRDATEIRKEWVELYGLTDCTDLLCKRVTAVRGRDRHRGRSSKNVDGLYAYYESIYHRVHQFIFHSFNSESRRNRLDDQDETTLTNNKFTIVAPSHSTSSGLTLKDALLEKLANEQSIHEDTVQRLNDFLFRNKYDSDAVAVDLENEEDSNLAAIHRDVLITIMSTFVRSINCMFNVRSLCIFACPEICESLNSRISDNLWFVPYPVQRSLFSTGYSFIYKKEQEVTRLDTVPHSWFNHSGGDQQINLNSFQVRPRFSSIKEEALNSGFLGAEEWMKFVELKAQRFVKTKKARKMVAVRIRYMVGGLREGEAITIHHLIAVILYCNFSALCTHFSATYRKTDVFESLKSIMDRHSHWYHLGQLLQECVHYFGSDGETDRGPFYCGLNTILHVPLGGIILYGPCSTTTMREVAVNFARSDGMVLSVDNDGTHYGSRNRHFDCSWISRYFEEDERLFLGEKYPLRLINITLERSAKNYRKMCTLMFILTTLLSGWRMKQDYDTTPNYDLFHLPSFLNDQISTLDLYLKNTFEWFFSSTRDIIINLWSIDQMSAKLSKFTALVVETVQPNVEYEAVIENPAINMVTPSIFGIFDEIDKLIIHSTSRRGRISYRFNIAVLIAGLESQFRKLSDEFTVIIKARVQPETRYKNIPKDIPTLKERMELHDISKSDLEKFQEEIDHENYDFDAIEDDVGHGIENSMLAESAREKMEIGENLFEILTTILEGRDAITPNNPEDDDYSSDEDVAAPLKEQVFPRRSWLNEVWKRGDFNLVRGWSVALEVGGKYMDEDHLILRPKRVRPRQSELVVDITKGMNASTITSAILPLSVLVSLPDSSTR